MKIQSKLLGGNVVFKTASQKRLIVLSLLQMYELQAEVKWVLDQNQAIVFYLSFQQEQVSNYTGRYLCGIMSMFIGHKCYVLSVICLRCLCLFTKWRYGHFPSFSFHLPLTSSMWEAKNDGWSMKQQQRMLRYQGECPEIYLLATLSDWFLNLVVPRIPSFLKAITLDLRYQESWVIETAVKAWRWRLS